MVKIQDNPITAHEAPQVELAKKSPPSPFQKDAILTPVEERRLSAEIAKSVSIASPKEKEEGLCELLIKIADMTEDLKTGMLKETLNYEQKLTEESATTQKELSKLLAERRKNTAALQEIDYLARVATALLSVFSLGAGISLTVSGTAPIPGTMMAFSGVSTLTAMTLEALGYSNDVTDAMSIGGTAVGLIATAIGGYLNPAIMKDSTVAMIQVMRALLTGISDVARSQYEASGSSLEADLTKERKDQEMIRIKIDHVFTGLRALIQNLTNTAEISKMMSKIQDLNYQYLNLRMTQG